MWASEASKTPILEFNLEKMLLSLELTQDQFIDVCILAGCDYADTIKGIAATTAFKMVKSEGSLDAVIASLDPDKHPVPEGVDYDEVRALFVAPEVADPATFDFKWAEPDEAGLKKYLAEEKGFNLARVEKGILALKKARTAGSQSRMDSFFASVPGPKPPAAAAGAGASAAGGKRKVRGWAAAACATRRAAPHALTSHRPAARVRRRARRQPRPEPPRSPRAASEARVRVVEVGVHVGESEGGVAIYERECGLRDRLGVGVRALCVCVWV